MARGGWVVSTMAGRRVCVESAEEGEKGGSE